MAPPHAISAHPYVTPGVHADTLFLTTRCGASIGRSPTTGPCDARAYRRAHRYRYCKVCRLLSLDFIVSTVPNSDSQLNHLTGSKTPGVPEHTRDRHTTSNPTGAHPPTSHGRQTTRPRQVHVQLYPGTTPERTRRHKPHLHTTNPINHLTGSCIFLGSYHLSYKLVYFYTYNVTTRTCSR